MTSVSAASFKGRLFQVLELSSGDRTGRVVSGLLTGLIFLNVLATILESVQSIHDRWWFWLEVFDIASVAIFAAEYLLRLWASPSDPRYAGALRGRLRFASTPLAVIDLLAILPAFLPILGVDLRALRALRLLRVLKLGRHSESLRILQAVVVGKRRELAVGLLVLGVLLVLASSAMYYLEHEAQPDRFPHIPAAMWWAIVTLTTVGYGDVYPVTAAGKVLGGLTVVFGVAVVAIPAAVFASGFMEELQKRTARVAAAPERCPHCGKDVHDKPARVAEPPVTR